MELYTIAAYTLAFIGLYATVFYILSLFMHYRKKNPIQKELTYRTVSIIIPAYNEELTIARTIKSALSLDYPNDKMEIIIVDDGSKDKTYEIAKKFELIHNNIRVFTKSNGGKGSALNLGIKKSKKEIIVTMDADTFVQPDVLKEMLPYFSNHDVMAVTPSMRVYKPHGFWERIQQIEYYMGVFLRKAFSTVNAVHITPGAFSAYRRSFFVKYKGYDEGNITEDLEIALRIQSHDYIIENAEYAAIYTVAPKKFMPLLVQRRRWYAGLIKNLWSYRRLFSPKKGALGQIVLPTAVITIFLSMILTIYAVIKTLIQLKNNLIFLQEVNFKFINNIVLSKYVFLNFFYSLFSNKLFLMSLLFMLILVFYMYFSKRTLKDNEDIALNFVIFLIFYTLLFAVWWAISFIYVMFNKKVIWRKE